MAILVTGALGVIGTRLTEELRDHGYDVKTADMKILQSPDYIRADVCRYGELARAFERWDIEHVYHFAGEVGRENGELFPNRCVDVNVSGTLNLIQLCKEAGARLYFASTSEVYGERGADVRLTEDLMGSDGILPHNCYGLSKLQAEHYLMHYVQHYGLEALSFRFFMCYGPPEYPNPFRSAMTNFVHSALTGQRISLHRNTARSWCYIDDIVRACRMAMEGFDPARGYQAYNIGRDDLRSMDDTARLIFRLAGASEDLIDVAEPGPFVTRVKNASFDKAKEHFGYESHISVEEGVERTIAWQRNVVLAPAAPAAVRA